MHTADIDADKLLAEPQPSPAILAQGSIQPAPNTDASTTASHPPGLTLSSETPEPVVAAGGPSLDTSVAPHSADLSLESAAAADRQFPDGSSPDIPIASPTANSLSISRTEPPAPSREAGGKPLAIKANVAPMIEIHEAAITGSISPVTTIVADSTPNSPSNISKYGIPAVEFPSEASAVASVIAGDSVASRRRSKRRSFFGKLKHMFDRDHKRIGDETENH